MAAKRTPTERVTNRYLSGILVDHDDNLSHIVEFRHAVDVLHRSDPLLIDHRLSINNNNHTDSITVAAFNAEQ